VIERAFEAVLFDLDDTLHDDTRTYREATRAVAATVARERGVDATALCDAYVEQAETFWAGLDERHLGMDLAALRARMWSGALATVGIRDAALAERSAIDYNRHRTGGLQLFPGVLSLLERLRAAGRRLALLTNGFAETHREKIALLRLERAFDAVLIADEVGMIKPDPRMFLRACEQVGSAPHASVMVGDRYDRDISGAAEAGLATIWVNPAGLGVPAGARQPDAIVPSFAGVERALARTLAPTGSR